MLGRLERLAAELGDVPDQLGQRHLALAVAARRPRGSGSRRRPARACGARWPAAAAAGWGCPRRPARCPGGPTTRCTTSCCLVNATAGSVFQPRRSMPRRGRGRPGLALHLVVRRLLGAPAEDEHRAEEAEEQRRRRSSTRARRPGAGQQQPEEHEADGGADQERASRIHRPRRGSDLGHPVGLDELLAPAHLLRGRCSTCVGAYCVRWDGSDGGCGSRRAARRPWPDGTADRRGTTNGPAARTARRRSRSRRPRRLSSTNSSGLTQRSTGWCRSEGRRYWVIVISSQPASCRSRSAWRDLLAGLAHAEDQVGLGDQAEVAGLGEHVERAVVAEGRPDPLEDPRHRLDVVGEHLGPRLEHLAEQVGLAVEVGDQVLDAGAGVELVDRAHGLGVQPGAAVRRGRRGRRR